MMRQGSNSCGRLLLCRSEVRLAALVGMVSMRGRRV